MGGFKLLQLLLSLVNADGLYDCIFGYILDNMALFFEFNVINTMKIHLFLSVLSIWLSISAINIHNKYSKNKQRVLANGCKYIY